MGVFMYVNCPCGTLLTHRSAICERTLRRRGSIEGAAGSSIVLHHAVLLFLVLQPPAVQPGEPKHPLSEVSVVRRHSVGAWHAEAREVLDFRGRDLVEGELGGGPGMGLDVLLQHQRVGIPLLADQALVEGADRGADLMHAHVGLQVTLGGEPAFADLASIGPFPCMGSVVHLQRRLAGQHLVADNALVGVGQLVPEGVDEVLEPAGLSLLVNFYKIFPGLVRVLHGG